MRLRALVFLFCLLALEGRAQAAVERFGVFIGSNHGARGEVELRYAQTDAERMSSVLRELGGFRPENVVVLRDEKADAVQRALISVNDRIRSAQSRGASVMLFVYYSGHADGRALHLGGSELELTLLEQLVRSSAAAFRVLMIDACRSGALTRVKGGTPAKAFSVVVDDSLDGEGTVFLTSSSANEDAQESDELGGSFFTHYFRSGLLGPADTDRDGRVTLDEAYRYAHGSTLRATSSTLFGTQHPTYRYELKGQGKLALTEPSAHASDRAVLRFPDGRDYLVLAGDSRGTVVGEVGAHDRVRLLSVAPGRYFVRGRASDHLLEGTVDARARETQLVADGNLHRIDYARLVRKGGGEVDSATAFELGYTVRTAAANAQGFCHGAFAGYVLALPDVSFTPWVGWCESRYRNSSLDVRVDAYDLGVRTSHVWDFEPLSFELGVDVGTTLHRQRFVTRGSAPARDTWGGRAGLGATLGFELAAGLSLRAGVDLEGHVLSVEDTETRDTRVVASLTERLRLGLARYW